MDFTSVKRKKSWILELNYVIRSNLAGEAGIPWPVPDRSFTPGVCVVPRDEGRGPSQ